MQQQEQQILQTCTKINQFLQLQQYQQTFTMKTLQKRDWYIQVLQIVYPQLSQKLSKLKSSKNQSKTIDDLLFILTEEQIIQEDFLEIKGADIVQGDIQSIYYVVQLLNALIQREAQEIQDDEQQQDQQNQDQQVQVNNYQSNAITSSTKPNVTTNNKHVGMTQSNRNNYDNLFNSQSQHLDSQDQQNHENHSVLGINHQFQQSEDQDQQVEHQQDIKVNYRSNDNQKKVPFQVDIVKKNTNQLVNTGIGSNTQYKMEKQTVANLKTAQNQNTKSNKGKEKYFPESEDQDHQNGDNQSAEEDQNQYFMNPTIKKSISDKKVKILTSANKSTTKKQITKHNFKSDKIQSKNSKQLVSHPTLKKVYRKATNPQAKALTNDVKQQISTILKKKKLKNQQKSQNDMIQEKRLNATQQQMLRKKKQMRIKVKDAHKQQVLNTKYKAKASLKANKSNYQLGNILNWRQGQLKKQKKQFQQAMQMKLQTQKQKYIKKVNTLIIRLQKQKQLQQRNDYKQKLVKENSQAAKRLTAIEKWYSDRLNMLKQNKIQGHDQRKLMHTGHKEILKQIQKQLKKTNQKQIMQMTMKFRKNQAEIQNDLEQLEREIIQVYKRN